ncbi:hypothetical protein D3C76_1645750 [compost metagenome]
MGSSNSVSPLICTSREEWPSHITLDSAAFPKSAGFSFPAVMPGRGRLSGTPLIISLAEDSISRKPVLMLVGIRFTNLFFA